MDRNLLEVLEEKPDGLDRESVKYFIYQLLKAVDYFHRQNVMHRDIKPENLLISSKTNELKVCDFGFARHLNNKNDIDNSSSNKSSNGDDSNNSPELTDYVATRWYRSPELLLVSENLPYGKEVDIWAVGCIMGELMDGQPLFPGDSEVDQLFVIQKVLGSLPDFLQDEFNRNTRYQGLKFPEITHPETIEARYAPVMNDVEIDIIIKMLEMDPY
jgi:cyclin-dependent kinase-like